MRERLARWLYREPAPRNPFDLRYQELMAQLPRAIDLGAGRGVGRGVAPHGALVVGVDPTPAVAENPTINHAVRADGDALPFPAHTFNLCIMRWVVEHLPNPSTTFAEVARVLRPGGRLLIMTSNLFHYAYLIAFLVPNRWHPAIIGRLYQREERDTFPTHYRANTPWRLYQHLTSVGLRRVSLSCFQHGPGYLGFSWPTYIVGAMYDKIVNATPHFWWLRQRLIAEFEKPVAHSHVESGTTA